MSSSPDAAYVPSADVLRTASEQHRALEQRKLAEVCADCGHPRGAHRDRYSSHGMINGFVCRATVHGDGFAYPCPCNRSSFEAVA